MRSKHNQSAGCEFTGPYLYSFLEPATQPPAAAISGSNPDRSAKRHDRRSGSGAPPPSREIKLLDRRPETARLLFLLGMFPYF